MHLCEEVGSLSFGRPTTKKVAQNGVTALKAFAHSKQMHGQSPLTYVSCVKGLKRRFDFCALSLNRMEPLCFLRHRSLSLFFSPSRKMRLECTSSSTERGARIAKCAIAFITVPARCPRLYRANSPPLPIPRSEIETSNKQKSTFHN